MSNIFKTVYLFVLFFAFSCQPQIERVDDELDSVMLERKRRIDSIVKLSDERKKHRQLSYESYSGSYQEPKSVSSKELNSKENEFEQTYYLIVGSFQDYENAMKMIKEFKGSEILQANDDVKRVSIAKLNGLNEAVEALKYFKEKYPDIPAWLYTK